VLAFNVQKLPLIGGGTTFHAAFAEAGGLRSGDPVRIAGVTVGKVTGVDLENAHVMVTFTVRGDSRLGRDTKAAVKLQTLLGKKYLELTPTGPGQLSGSRNPARQHHLVVRRGRRVLRPDHDDRADRHRPAGDVARDALDRVQEQPGRR